MNCFITISDLEIFYGFFRDFSSGKIFFGFQNAGWRITEVRDPDGSRNTVTIRTRAVSRLAELAQVKGIKSNVTSHQQFFGTDTFFQNVPDIMDKAIDWGGGDKRGQPGRPSRVYP